MLSGLREGYAAFAHIAGTYALGGWEKQMRYRIRVEVVTVEDFATAHTPQVTSPPPTRSEQYLIVQEASINHFELFGHDHKTFDGFLDLTQGILRRATQTTTVAYNAHNSFPSLITNWTYRNRMI